MVGLLSPEASFNDPAFSVEVEGIDLIALSEDFADLVQRVEYESTDGIADIARVTVVNPDFELSNKKVFQPGNEMSIFLGYGQNLVHIGRVVITKVRPTFPQDGMPTIQVIGYSKDTQMMDNAPERSKKEKAQKRRKKKGSPGRIFKDMRFSDALKEKLETYDFEDDIDQTPDAPHNFLQKVGLSDYDFAIGISNITGFIFWVDANEDGRWTMHLKDPAKLLQQDEEFTFIYDNGQLSSLLSFSPQMLIQGSQTKIAVRVKDIKSGRIFEAEVEEENDGAPDIDASGDPLAELDGDHTTASDIKLFINDFSFSVTSNRRFQTEAEVIAWALQWFRKTRENFVLARGRTIGAESLRSRQVHKIEGIESGLEGDYYFTRVKHILDNSGGYLCDFSARKVVPN